MHPRLGGWTQHELELALVNSCAVPTVAPCSPVCVCIIVLADFEKGFIRAETVAYHDYVTAGGMGAAKVRSVG